MRDARCAVKHVHYEIMSVSNVHGLVTLLGDSSNAVLHLHDLASLFCDINELLYSLFVYIHLSKDCASL